METEAKSQIAHNLVGDLKRFFPDASSAYQAILDYLDQHPSAEKHDIFRYFSEHRGKQKPHCSRLVDSKKPTKGGRFAALGRRHN